MLSLHPSISYADFGDRVVTLDLGRDRYDLLGGRLALTLRSAATTGWDADDEAVSTLLRSGHLQTGAPIRPTTLPSAPRRSAFEAGRSTPVSRLRLARALIGSRIALRATGLEIALKRSLVTSRHLPERNRMAAETARGVAATRARIGIAQCCLPDALALRSLLVARGCGSVLILGVRLDPFGAHAWLQTGDIVLTDELEAIAPFTPILAS
jgi:hypothetical protein